jgi:hypothetical protein
MPPPEPDAGLCGDCAHCHRIVNARGSAFHLCRRAEDDPAYARYPQLPVQVCPGYEPRFGGDESKQR